MTLPATFSEAEMIDTVDIWIGEIQESMTAQYSREWLEAKLRDHLQGGLTDMLWVVEAADRGDVIADAALRRVYAEMRNRHETPPVILEGYIIKTLARGAVTRGRGQFWFDDWRRNIGIAALVFMTAREFGLHPTRNRAQTRRRQASACSVVAAALWRRNVYVKEGTVENIWAKLQNEVSAYVTGRGTFVPK
jgi:hypothetical protein